MTSASDSELSTADRRAGAGAKERGAAGETFDLIKTVLYALLIALVLRVVLFQPFTIPSASMEPTVFQGDYIIVSKFAYGWSRNSIPFSPPLPNGRFLGRAPHRGDVVVFKLPRDGHVDYIKRLIGLPGDHIQVRAGELYINDRLTPRTALPMAATTCPTAVEPIPAPRWSEALPGGRTHEIATCFSGQGGGNDTGVYVVPPGCYFMMGDNRDNSIDSRYPPYPGPAQEAALQRCPWDPALERSLGNLDAGVGYVPFENLVGKADLILFSWGAHAALFKPWTWVTEIRLNRWLHILR